VQIEKESRNDDGDSSQGRDEAGDDTKE